MKLKNPPFFKTLLTLTWSNICRQIVFERTLGWLAQLKTYFLMYHVIDSERCLHGFNLFDYFHILQDIFLTEQTFDRSLHHYLTDNWAHITAQIINDLFYQNKTTWNLTFSKSDNMLNYLKSARRHWRRTSRGEITSGSEKPEISRPEVAFHAVSSSSL
jgi:hypothetical protein